MGLAVSIFIAAFVFALFVVFIFSVANERGEPINKFDKAKEEWEHEIDEAAARFVLTGYSPDEAMEKAIERVNELRQVAALHDANLGER